VEKEKKDIQRERKKDAGDKTRQKDREIEIAS